VWWGRAAEAAGTHGVRLDGSSAQELTMAIAPDALDAVLREGYGFDDDAVVLGRPLDPGLGSPLKDHDVQVPLRQLNKHGLVAGATGTGTTKTLQVFAEQLSRAGRPGVPRRPQG
jgi:hypothetical protein